MGTQILTTTGRQPLERDLFTSVSRRTSSSTTAQLYALQRAYRLLPVPSQRWHLTILSPFLRVPFPSQFLHFAFFFPVAFCMLFSAEKNQAAFRMAAVRSFSCCIASSIADITRRVSVCWIIWPAPTMRCNLLFGIF